MEKTYEVSATQIEEAERKIRSIGGTLENGKFYVKGVKGTYSIGGSLITINVESKPFLASWGMIESELDKFFTN
tara:strand:+ start:1264 stop:1485 length:222 start_codon:yes stop_codon:yes gene_type:complete